MLGQHVYIIIDDSSFEYGVFNGADVPENGEFVFDGAVPYEGEDAYDGGQEAVVTD